MEDAVRNNAPTYPDNVNQGQEGEAIQAPAIEDEFSRDARWVELQQLSDPVEDPTKEGFRPPTQPVDQTITNIGRNSNKYHLKEN